MKKNGWQKYIHSNPDVLLGKPVVKGTRLSIEFITGLLAKGWNEKQIAKNYPAMTPAVMKAVYSYINECLKDELMFPIPK